jgi:hypothetical protein
MDQNYPSTEPYQPYVPPEPPYQPPAKSNGPRIILIVVIVLLLLCCCCVIFGLLMYFVVGDMITNSMGITQLLLPVLTL